jgi:hypothetical protein
MLCITMTHCLTLPFPQGNFFFLPKTWLSSLTHLNFLFTWLKTKLRGRHSDKIWGDRGRKADGTQHPHRSRQPWMHLKNCRRAWNGTYAWKETTSRVMMASRPKVSFWPDGNTSPGNYRWLFVYFHNKLWQLKSAGSEMLHWITCKPHGKNL